MPSEILQTDICIIGAGPSGAITSLFLSKMKIPHTLIDAEIFPRDKVCGDALDLKVMRVLNQLDPGLVEKEIFNDPFFSKAWGCRIIISKNKKTDLLYQPKPGNLSYPFFLVSKRAYFDNYLVKKIDPVYADFRQGTLAKKISRENGNWKIFAQKEGDEIEIRARLIVGADGDHSVLLKSLGERKINRNHYAGGVRQYWKGITGVHPDNCLEFYFPKKLPLAYFWIFPLPGGEANVGCGLVSKLISERKVNLKKLINDIITEDPAIAPRFKDATPLESPVGWGLPLASAGRRASGDGWLLVGDAASLICPTNGEGIGPGMISGYIAALFIERAVQKNRFDSGMFENYDREIKRRLQNDIKNYNRIRNFSPGIYNLAINILSLAGLSGYIFRRNILKWVSNAKKTIDVNL